ncbi:hypothetical protein OH76DRAFT_1401816 [Lentinus brumalis]|uniref:Mating-type protein A-alpha/beta 1 N-terminal domain-containing protein n=1 Tax=Lentinus brumalis TaxID=2498619 RepID=A0A371DEU9_9APHY|nr:hypothetical protein OH76DRAFT_1401816 [Polyporus brumalis]
MCSLQERLLAAEDAFLLALSDGGSALTSFDHHWESLMAEADLAIESAGADSELPGLVHATATRIATLASISTELYVSYDTINSKFMDQIDSLMSQLTLVDDVSGGVRYSVTEESATPSPRKRRRDCSPSPGMQDPSRRSSKRRCRSDARDEKPIPVARSPTPKEHKTPPPAMVAFTTATTPSSLKRKRRLSDADSCTPRGPQKRLHTGPRVQAVSDSFFIVGDSSISHPLRPSAPFIPTPCHSIHDATSSLVSISEPFFTNATLPMAQSYVDVDHLRYDIMANTEVPQEFDLGPLSFDGFDSSSLLLPELSCVDSFFGALDEFSSTTASGDDLSPVRSPAMDGYARSCSLESLPPLDSPLSDRPSSPESVSSCPVTPPSNERMILPTSLYSFGSIGEWSFDDVSTTSQLFADCVSDAVSVSKCSPDHVVSLPAGPDDAIDSGLEWSSVSINPEALLALSNPSLLSSAPLWTKMSLSSIFLDSQVPA